MIFSLWGRIVLPRFARLACGPTLTTALITAVGFASVLAADPASAQSLFRNVKASTDAGRNLEVEVDFALWDARPSELTLDLPGGERLDLARGRMESSSGRDVWRGESRQGSVGYGVATLTRVENRLWGQIAIPNGLFEIRPGEGGTHRVAAVHLDGFCGEPELSRAEPRPIRPEPDVDGKMGEDKMDQDEITIMILLVRPELGELGPETLAMAHNAVDFTNTVWLNSEVEARLKLRNIFQISIEDLRQDFPDSDNFRDLTGILYLVRRHPRVQEWREAWGADLVAVLGEASVVDDPTACGRGSVPTTGLSRNSGFSATDLGCVGTSFIVAHEIGHNMGGHHDPESFDELPQSLYPWTFGHKAPGRFSTLMSTRCAGCTRLPQFSHPGIDYSGTPTGIEDQRDNHRTVNRTSFGVSQYFPDLEPVVLCEQSTVLCLNDNRFAVEVGWRDFEDRRGSARKLSLRSDDTGMLWFFDSQNWELMLKVLDGCAVNGSYWFFGTSISNLEFAITVTDLETGLQRRYFNPLGSVPPAITDTTAFPCS